MTTADEATTQIDGTWELTWRPASFPPLTGVFTLTRDGDSLSVRTEDPAGTSTGEGAVDGRNLSWHITVPGRPAPVLFEAAVEGDVLLGHVELKAGLYTERAPLEGVRVGSGGLVPFREGSVAVAETLAASGVEYVFGYTGGVSVSLERSIIAHGIKDMNARNELSAAWMSYGYNRVKRRAASAALMWCVGSLHASCGRIRGQTRLHTPRVHADRKRGGMGHAGHPAGRYRAVLGVQATVEVHQTRRRR